MKRRKKVSSRKTAYEAAMLLHDTLQRRYANSSASDDYFNQTERLHRITEQLSSWVTDENTLFFTGRNED